MLRLKLIEVDGFEAAATRKSRMQSADGNKANTA